MPGSALEIVGSDQLLERLHRSEPERPVVVLVPEGSADVDLLAGIGEAAAAGRAGVVIEGFNPSARVIVALGAGEASVFFRAALHGGHQLFLAPVEIAVLGPVEAHGVDAFGGRRPKLTELDAYLAMHPEGASARKWTAALWPDRRVPPQTVSNRLSEARRLLGFASDGRPRLRRIGERYLLHEVTTDWHRFQSLTQPSEPLASWRAALELIRGQPFLDLHEGHWALLEGILPEMERSIVAAALRYASASLHAGEVNDAAWAAQQALRACPWNEELHRVLMRAADAAGNRAGVEETLRHLALVLEIDGDPLVGVHPETAALYRRLFEPALE